MSDERTHEPTPRRRQQAREAGQVAHSQELVSALVLLGSLALLLVSGASLVEFLAGFLKSGLSGGAWKSWIGTAGGPSPIVAQWNTLVPGLARVLIPLLAGAAVVVVGAHLVQNGFLFRPRRIAPDLARISPATGLRRIFSTASLAQLALGLVKVGIVGGIAFAGLWSKRQEIAQLAALDPQRMAAHSWQICFTMAGQLGGALFALALVDYAYQRWKLARDLRMTPQELREEMRELEGDPQVRSRRRELAGKYARPSGSASEAARAIGS